MNELKLCKFDNCDRIQFCGEYCQTHYHRDKRGFDMSANIRGKKPEIKPCAVDGCRDWATKLQYCSVHHSRFVRNGDPEITTTTTPIGEPMKFFESCMKLDTDECIIWKYSIGSHGYGDMRVNGKNILVHRMSLELSCGPPVGDKKFALHSCHVRSCFNPRHLRWGTPRDNALDTVLCGRNPSKSRRKLTDEQVVFARDISFSQSEMAKKLGVSASLIQAIRDGRTYKDVC